MGDIRERKDKAKNKPIVKHVVQRISIKQWHVEYFFKIIDEEIEDLLEYDVCNKLADKYLIAMAFMYFLRAAYRPEDYTRFNFLSALCLAHDMEEEDDDYRAELLLFAAPDGCSQSADELFQRRLYLFKRMNYRAVVSRVSCDSLMHVANSKHPVWRRVRHAVHSGANRSYDRTRIVCPNCIGALSDSS